MLLFNIDDAVNAEKEIVKISSIYEIEKYRNTDLFPIVPFEEQDLVQYQKQRNFALKVKSLEEFILAMNTEAKYAFCSKELALRVQKCADSYLADIKVIVEIATRKDLEWAAENEIDGIYLNS